MKNKILLITLFICSMHCSLRVSGQRVELTGRIALLNSKYKTGAKQFIPNVYVRGSGSDVDYTDINGVFHLNFVDVAKKSKVSLNVVKRGYIVIDSSVIENVGLGRSDTLEITMGNINTIEADIKFYTKSIVSQLLNDKNKQLKILEAERQNAKGSQRSAIIDQIDNIRSNKIDIDIIKEIAKRISLTNMDYAPDFIISAFLKFKQGDINGAILLMQPSMLDIIHKKSLAEEKKQRNVKNLTINSYEFLGNCHYIKHRFDSAISFFEEALNVINAYSDSESFHYDKARIMERIGDSYFEAGQYKEAVSSHKKSLAIKLTHNCTDNSLIADSYYYIGTSYSAHGHHDSGLKYGFAALEFWKKEGDLYNKDIAKAYNNIAVAYGDLGYYKQQILYLDSAIISTPEKDSLTLDYATFIANTGASYGNLGYSVGQKLGSDTARKLFEKAYKYNLRGLNLRIKILDSLHPHLAFSYSNLGVSCIRLGDFEKGREFIDKSISLRMAIDSLHPDIAVSYLNLGNYYYERGDFKNELEYTLKGFVILKQAVDSMADPLARAYGNVGLAYQDLKKYDSALIYLLKVPPIYEDRGDSIALIRSYSDISDIYLFLKDYSNSAHYYLKALKIKEKMHENDSNFYKNLILDYLALSELFFSNRLFDSALIYSKLYYSMDIIQKSADSINEYRCKKIIGLSFLEIANNYRDNNYLSLSFAYYDSSLLFFEKNARIIECKAKAQLAGRFYREALENYALACELDTSIANNSQIQNYMGICYFYLEKTDSASMFFQKSFNSGMDSATYYNNFGLSEVKNGHYVNSEQCLIYLINNFEIPSYLVHRNMAFAFAKKRRYKSLVQSMEKALQYGYSDEEFFNNKIFRPYRNKKRFKKLKFQIENQLSINQNVLEML